MTRDIQDKTRFRGYLCGYKEGLKGKAKNPYPSGSLEWEGWEEGYVRGQEERAKILGAPLCKFGPGGDYVKHWPKDGV